MMKPRIVVVGSLHYDIMIDAPDRPRKGETVVGHRWRPKFGGKGGNQAVAAAAAGAEVEMVSAVGEDAFGDFLLARLSAAGVGSQHVARLAGVGSGMSVAIGDDEGDYGAVIVSGANRAFDLEAANAAGVWTGAQVLVLQNEVPDTINIASARLARAHGAKVCLNAAPFRPLPDELKPLIDCLVVNAIEAEGLCGIAVTDLASAAAAATALGAHWPLVVVTAGGDGVAAKAEGMPVLSIPAVQVTLVSTHGAGDVFVGELAYGLASGKPLANCLATANAAAARHVSRPAG